MDVDAALGILQHLDKSMLQGLLDDEDKLLDIIKDSEQVIYWQQKYITYIATAKKKKKKPRHPQKYNAYNK